MSSDLRGKENGLFSKKTEKSVSVAGNLKISNQIIDDFIETAEVASFLVEQNFFKTSNCQHSTSVKTN